MARGRMSDAGWAFFAPFLRGARGSRGRRGRDQRRGARRGVLDRAHGLGLPRPARGVRASGPGPNPSPPPPDAGGAGDGPGGTRRGRHAPGRRTAWPAADDRAAPSCGRITTPGLPAVAAVGARTGSHRPRPGRRHGAAMAAWGSPTLAPEAPSGRGRVLGSNALAGRGGARPAPRAARCAGEGSVSAPPDRRPASSGARPPRGRRAARWGRWRRCRPRGARRSGRSPSRASGST